MEFISIIVGQNTELFQGLKQAVLYRKKRQASLPVRIFITIITCYPTVCMLSEVNYLIFPDRQREEIAKCLNWMCVVQMNYELQE
jgi:hypothetical protein